VGSAVTRGQAPAPRAPNGSRWGGPLAARAVAIAVAASVALFVLQWIALRTTDGQQLDQRAFGAFQRRPWSHLNLPARLLSDVSVGTAILACVVIGAIAMLRGRRSHALAAALLVIGANVTVQLLKHVVLERTALAVIAPNSFPSGHVCVVASLVLAALLVLPPTLRGLLAVPGAIWITVMAVSTVIAGWHRVSDIVAALLVCLGWAALAAAVLGWGSQWHVGRMGLGAIWWMGCAAAVCLAIVLDGLTVVSPAGNVGSRELLGVAASVVVIGVSSAAVIAIWCRLLTALDAAGA
jgi:membrane-associated phospholipid phosphatase